MAFFEDNYYETSDRPVRLRLCEHPNCGQPGDYRAPKSRDHLDSYYWFCLDHVRDYNKNWDYFAGLSAGEIEDYNRSASVWERPTWPMGQWRIWEAELRDKVNREFYEETPREAAAASPFILPAAREAFLILELKPSVDFAAIKAQYRILVKQHHPDLHGGSVEAEEKFKSINQAFAVLRQFYEADKVA